MHAAIPREASMGLGINVALKPCFSAIDFVMNLKNCVYLPCLMRRQIPNSSQIDHLHPHDRFDRLPSHFKHTIANLGYNIVAAHNSLLVIARFYRGI